MEQNMFFCECSRRLLIVATALHVLAMLVLITVSQASAADEIADRLELGRTIYAKHCASCHGAKLEGQPNWRKRKADGRLPAPPHDASGHSWHHDDEHLFRITKEGPAEIIGGGYVSNMPGFADTLSDAEIKAVIIFIKSKWPERIRKRHDRINRRQ
jgi:mono/diheme cytochrome c family protein